MRKSTVLLMFTIVVVISVLLGVFSVSDAANVFDTSYSFYNMSNEIGYCDERDKTNTTKVFVHPTSGPSVYYTVQGRKGKLGTWRDRSNTYLITINTYASITNRVHEEGDTEARLKFTRYTIGQVYTNGVWSPDSTQNYTVYP